VGVEEETVGEARDALLVRVEPDQHSDAEELARLAGLLRTELLELDVLGVDPVADADAPARAKGLGILEGLLAVRVGGLDAIRAVLSTIRSWAARSNREIEVSIGDDVLRVTGVSSAQQEKIIDAWLARHAPGP
jgi:hypothetical protein